MAKQYAVYVCGLPELLGEPQPCPKGGPLHTAEPTGYDAHYEYAGQLLSTGWQQHRCPACGLWQLWRPDQPQPQPPMRDTEDGAPWDLPEDVDELGCPSCQDDPEADAPPCPVVAA